MSFQNSHSDEPTYTLNYTHKDIACVFKVWGDGKFRDVRYENRKDLLIVVLYFIPYAFHVDNKLRSFIFNLCRQDTCIIRLITAHI